MRLGYIMTVYKKSTKSVFAIIDDRKRVAAQFEAWEPGAQDFDIPGTKTTV